MNKEKPIRKKIVIDHKGLNVGMAQSYILKEPHRIMLELVKWRFSSIQDVIEMMEGRKYEPAVIIAQLRILMRDLLAQLEIRIPGDMLLNILSSLVFNQANMEKKILASEELIPAGQEN